MRQADCASARLARSCLFWLSSVWALFRNCSTSTRACSASASRTVSSSCFLQGFPLCKLAHFFVLQLRKVFVIGFRLQNSVCVCFVFGSQLVDLGLRILFSLVLHCCGLFFVLYCFGISVFAVDCLLVFLDSLVACESFSTVVACVGWWLAWVSPFCVAIQLGLSLELVPTHPTGVLHHLPIYVVGCDFLCWVAIVCSGCVMRCYCLCWVAIVYSL